jgi:hypothetical protein
VCYQKTSSLYCLLHQHKLNNKTVKKQTAAGTFLLHPLSVHDGNLHSGQPYFNQELVSTAGKNGKPKFTALPKSPDSDFSLWKSKEPSNTAQPRAVSLPGPPGPSGRNQLCMVYEKREPGLFSPWLLGHDLS